MRVVSRIESKHIQSSCVSGGVGHGARVIEERVLPKQFVCEKFCGRKERRKNSCVVSTRKRLISEYQHFKGDFNENRSDKFVETDCTDQRGASTQQTEGTVNEALEGIITVEEVQAAINALKKGKAPGPVKHR
ncbi:hypothetical protein BaRGS_00031399 [Batillaria attramentaria]|uniref:Uncharacterized protein n=1 Tax=Batillaria attramentaria TaxID=370345 RepID=A0ABD0JQR1_9CAEN